jgi:hypothetical protein
MMTMMVEEVMVVVAVVVVVVLFVSCWLLEMLSSVLTWKWGLG